MDLPLIVWVAAALVVWVFCAFVVIGCLTFGDDLPFNRPVRGLMVIFAPLTVLAFVFLVVLRVLLGGFWEVVKK